MNVYDNMKEHNIKLPQAPSKGGVYAPAKQFGGNLVYISGCGPINGEPITGVTGVDYTKEEVKIYAKMAMENVLSVLEAKIKDLNKVKSAVKILVFVASDNSFTEQPYVANGATELLVQVFGEEIGMPSRSAIGVNVLPGNIPVEVEAVFELDPY